MKRARVSRRHFAGAIAFGVATSLAWMVCPERVLAQDAEPAEPGAPTIVRTIQGEAERVRTLVESPLALRFLQAARCLPEATARDVLFDESTRRYYSPAEAARLPEELRDALARKSLDASRYYTTKYGTPIAYVRAIELAGQSGIGNLSGGRVLDFGYGGIGHLRLLASTGVHAVGVDVDSFLTALYCEPTDHGPVPNCLAEDGAPGSVSLIEGRWPSTSDVIDDVGDGYDLFISKNTLKRGYIHPEREANPRQLIDLGVDDATYIAHLHRILKPGGIAVIYNLCPKQAPLDEPFIPWADGRCPFDAALLQKTGFEIIAMDVDDSDVAREIARALGWEEMMDLENDLFAMYTILRKE